MGVGCVSKCVDVGHRCPVVDRRRVPRKLWATIRCVTIWAKAFGVFGWKNGGAVGSPGRSSRYKYCGMESSFAIAMLMVSGIV